MYILCIVVIRYFLNSAKSRVRTVRAPRHALRAKRSKRTPRTPRHAFNEGCYARPPLRRRAASIKQSGAEQSGSDPFRPAGSTGVLGYSYPDESEYLSFRIRKEHGCSRLFISESAKARAFSAFESVSGRLGYSRSPLLSRARAFSALPPLAIRLGRSRPLPLYKNTRLLGSASALAA